MSEDSNLFSVYGRMTALPGRRDDLIAALVDGLQASADGGLLSYSISTDLDDADSLWLTQLWVDRAAHDATTASAAVTAASGRIPALLAGAPEGRYGVAVQVHPDSRSTEQAAP